MERFGRWLHHCSSASRSFASRFSDARKNEAKETDRERVADRGERVHRELGVRLASPYAVACERWVLCCCTRCPQIRLTAKCVLRIFLSVFPEGL